MENQDRYQVHVVNISLEGDGDIPYQQSIADQAAEEAVRIGLAIVAASGFSLCWRLRF